MQALCLQLRGASAAVARSGVRHIAALPRFDFKLLKERREEMTSNIARRNAQGDPVAVLDLYEQYVQARTHWDEIQQNRTLTGEEMKKSRDAGRREALKEAGRLLKAEQSDVTARTTDLVARLSAEASKLPNWVHPDVPGPGERPRVIEERGVKPSTPKTVDHLAIAQDLGLVDFASAAKVSGSRFCFMKGDGALLELALINFAVSKAIERGYVPIITPDLVYTSIAVGTGYQPRGDASQMYAIEQSGSAPDAPSSCLIATSEIPLAGMYSDTILAEAELPIKMVGISHCFRREVGSYGQESRGLYRVHQFSKVELFNISRAEDDEAALQEITDIQRSIFDDLGLHYQVLDMPVDDLGASAYRKIDFEAWMPGRGGYGEISSASNCIDYQSRRLNIRYRPTQAGERPSPTRFVHTLNGTACAVPRIILALIENGASEDGKRVDLPACLHPYMAGRTFLSKKL